MRKAVVTDERPTTAFFLANFYKELRSEGVPEDISAEVACRVAVQHVTDAGLFVKASDV